MEFQRLDRIEHKQLETDDKVNQLFKQLDQPKPDKAVIFFKGQMWDAGKKAFEISINEDDGILKGILSRL